MLAKKYIEYLEWCKKIYADTNILERKFNEGYIEISLMEKSHLFGGERMLWLWAFFYPNDQTITTYECKKDYSDGFGFRHSPYEARYNRKKFQEHLNDFSIKMTPKLDLGLVVSTLNSLQ